MAKPTLIDPAQVVERAALLGIGDELIADLLQVPVGKVRIARTARMNGHVAPPDDEELADAVRKIVRLGLEEAWRVLRFGTDEQRFRIALLIVGRTAPLFGVQASSRIDQLREEMARLSQLAVGEEMPPDGWHVAPILPED